MSLLYLIFIISILLLITTLTVFSGLIVFAIVKVPFVPAPKKGVEKMLKLAKIKPKEKIYDLGCGNGNVIFKAEQKYHAQAIGFEISPWPYLLAQFRKFVKTYQAKIYFKNFLKQDLSNADIIFCYLMPSACQKLAKKLDKELTSKTRIISYGYELPNFTNFKLAKKWYNRNTPIYKYQTINIK